MKNKKIAMICFVIVIGIVCFAPIPKYIDTALQGIKLEDDSAGKNIANTENDLVNISIKGWRLNYLFHSDKIKGTLAIFPYDYENDREAVFEFTGDILKPLDDAETQWSTIVRYSAELNRYVFGTVFYSSGFEKIMMVEMIGDEDKGNYYVASDEKCDESPVEIFEHFKVYTD